MHDDKEFIGQHMYIHSDIIHNIAIYMNINCDILSVGTCVCRAIFYFLEISSQGTEILGI